MEREKLMKYLCENDDFYKDIPFDNYSLEQLKMIKKRIDTEKEDGKHLKVIHRGASLKNDIRRNITLYGIMAAVATLFLIFLLVAFLMNK